MALHVRACAHASKPRLTATAASWRIAHRGVQIADIKIKTSEQGGTDDAVEAYTITLYKMKENGGFSRVFRKKDKKPPISKLKSNGVYVLDTGFELFLWIGDKAPTSLKGSAFPFAQKYLKSYKRPAVLPIHRDKEGREGDKIKTFLGPAEEDGMCAGCMPGCVIA